ncbi:MAG TPA: amino acid racemase [Pyrinomonadaceae bacterium]|jgi:aspartate racemase|nr:amino acid racemase [Pyrinomonadaceae bacterium]
MKTVGVIGGIGPESTIEYYRLIIASYRAQKQDESYPSIIINSVDMTRMLAFIASNELSEAAAYLIGEVEKLARAGADFAVLAANTPHIVFAEVSRRAPVPLLSIVKATCEAAKDSGLKKLGLFGTRFTMQAGFYQDVFSNEALTLVLPDEDEQEYIHNKYMNELVKGIFLPDTRARLLSIAGRLKKDESIEGVILGGTELPLILRDSDVKDMALPFLDTTRIHVEAIVTQLLS